MSAKLKTAVLGVTGYSGFELARILLRHPRLETPLLLSRSDSSENSAAKNAVPDLAHLFPAISGNGGHLLHTFSWNALQHHGVDLLFLATPHEVSREQHAERHAHDVRHAHRPSRARQLADRRTQGVRVRRERAAHRRAKRSLT